MATSSKYYKSISATREVRQVEWVVLEGEAFKSTPTRIPSFHFLSVFSHAWSFFTFAFPSPRSMTD